MARRAAGDRPGETGSQQEPELHERGNGTEIFRGVDGVQDNQVGVTLHPDWQQWGAVRIPLPKSEEGQSPEPRRMWREEASQWPLGREEAGSGSRSHWLEPGMQCELSGPGALSRWGGQSEGQTALVSLGASPFPKDPDHAPSPGGNK